jgi:hypothetical protein
MLERSRRRMADEDRKVLAQYRRQAVGSVPFEAKVTFLVGAAGLVAGFVWLGFFHLGDRGAPFWPIVALVAAGAAVGFPIDFVRARNGLRQRQDAAAAQMTSDPSAEMEILIGCKAKALVIPIR